MASPQVSNRSQITQTWNSAASTTWLEAALQPRISNLIMRAVPSPESGYVIVVRIPRSYNQPHRVIHSNSNRFWARSPASPKRYEPNVEELRRIFNEAPLTAERIRAFRTDRIVK